MKLIWLILFFICGISGTVCWFIRNLFDETEKFLRKATIYFVDRLSGGDE